MRRENCELFFDRNWSCFFYYIRIGRKKSLVYFMILAAIAASGAVLFTMYDPGDDKCKLYS